MKALFISIVVSALLPFTAMSQIFRQPVPGTTYTVGLPPSFAPSADKEKLEDADNQETFFMVAAPVPFEAMKGFFDVENLKKRGINLVSTEQTTFNRVPALFLKALQLQETGEVASLMLLFDDGKETLIATATFPANKPELEAKMKTALFSVKKNQ